MKEPENLKLVIDDCRKLFNQVGQANPDLTKNPWNFTVMSLFQSLVEIAASINTLHTHKETVGIPILARSFLECSMDFFNLVNDRSYGFRLQSNYIKEWLSLLENACKHESGNELKSEDWKNFKKEKENEKSTLEKNHHFKPINIEHKFRLAGQQEAYDTIYRQLCCDSHNNLRAVYSRSIAIRNSLPDHINEGRTIGMLSLGLREAEDKLHLAFGWPPPSQ